jgi:hypothetical protein
MSEDTFTEITTESWFGRFGGAFKGILVGFVLFLAAFPLLFWNEGRAVRRYKTLNEGAGSVISLPEARVWPENEGKLVHVSGQAVTDDIVADTEFGVAVNAIKLKRKVEMYQWKESQKRRTQKKLGGGKTTVTTYSYNKSWSSNLIDSTNFKKPNGHQNPGSMAYRSEEFVAAEVSLGEFKLSRSLIGKINRTAIMPVADLADIGGFPDAGFHGSGIYFGADPSSPQIGDLRISYHIVAPTEVSIISRQIGQSFESYRAEAGGSINMLAMGIIGADNMFQQARQTNVMWTWIFRLGGFVLMLVGTAMILRPLSVLADVIPLLGALVGAGNGILSFLIAAPFACVTIAIAWLRYRPVIGMLFLILAMVIAGLVLVLSKRRKASGASSPANTQSVERHSHKDLASDNADRVPSIHPVPTKSDKLTTAAINSMPQTAKADAIQKKAAEMLKEGQKYFRSGQYDKAVSQFSQVIKSGGNRKLALYNRGVALFKLKKKDAALKDFKIAAKLGHDKAQAILNQIKPA